MNSRRIAFYLCAVIAAGFTITAIVSSQTPHPDGRTRWDARRSLGAPKTFRNLTLIPIYSSITRAGETYMTLDEGLKAKTVQVKESKGGGEVNTLFLTNTGRKPVYVMAGEVVMGGQQDRCLGRDTIVPPGKRNLPITVFCVEHGRWTGRSGFDSTTLAAAAPDIRAEVQEGAFYAGRQVRPAVPASAGAVRSGAGRRIARQQSRLSAQMSQSAGIAYTGDAQQKVWDKVAVKNRRFGVESATGTYQKMLNMEGGDAYKRVAPYLKALAGSLGSDPHLVGVVAAVNGKVTMADVFGDSSLFRRLWPKLLRSYAADAAERANDVNSGTTLSAAQAKVFLLYATDAKSRTENRSESGVALRLESKDSRTYLLMPLSKRTPAQAGGGFGGAVHGSFMKK